MIMYTVKHCARRRRRGRGGGVATMSVPSTARSATLCHPGYQSPRSAAFSYKSLPLYSVLEGIVSETRRSKYWVCHNYVSPPVFEEDR